MPSAAPPILEKKWNRIESKLFTINIGLAIFIDYNSIGQNDESIQQVGEIKPEVEFRADRIILSGNLLFFKNPWRYMIAANYNGLDGEDVDPTFAFIDVDLEIPFGKKGGWITIGKQKEGIGHEYVLPGSQAMFTERGSGTPALIKQRNIGIRYSNSVLNHRMTWTAGIFNNWLENGNQHSFADNAMQVTFRATGLPIYKSDRELMHVGIGYRYTGATDGKLSYKAKPEVNTAPVFINTGSFDASSANTLMLEWIGVKGPFSFIGEYMNVWVNSASAGNPAFHYGQFGGSWFITGDNRKYNKQTGNMGKLTPKKNFGLKPGKGLGAVEIGARYTYSDFTDRAIDGGKFGRFTGALGWFPNAHLRFEANYGHGKLDKNNLIGKTDFWQFRAQFEL